MLFRFPATLAPAFLVFACVSETLNKRGEPGPQGERGPAGESCYISDSRADGLTITCGEGPNLKVMDIPFGRNGENGRDGKDGKDGKDGIDGKNGSDGTEGRPGKSCLLVRETPEFVEISCPKADGTMTNVMIKNGNSGTKDETVPAEPNGGQGNSCVVTERNGAVDITCGSSSVTINIDQKVCEASGGIFQNGSCQKTLPNLTNEEASATEPFYQPGERKKILLKSMTREPNGRFCYEDYRGTPETDSALSTCSRTEFTAGCYNPSIKTILWFPNGDGAQFKNCKPEYKVLGSADVQQFLMNVMENNVRAYALPPVLREKFCTATARSLISVGSSTMASQDFSIAQGSQFVINGYGKVGRTYMYLAIQDIGRRWIQWDAPVDMFDIDCDTSYLVPARRAIYLNLGADFFADGSLNKKICTASPGFIKGAAFTTFTDDSLVLEGPQVETACKVKAVFAAPEVTDRAFAGFLK